VPLRFLYDGLVLDGSGGGHQHVGSAIVTRQISLDARRIERAHGLRRAENGTANRLIGKRGRLQAVEHQIVRRIFGSADFLHNDVLLAPQFLWIESRLGQDVRQHVERQRHIGLKHSGIIGGTLHAGHGIEIAADRLDGFGDLAGGAPLGALERHMFEQMRYAVFVGLFIAAAGADPDAKRGRFQMRHAVGDHRQARGKTRYFDAHVAAPSRAARDADITKRSTAA
jgi:hypothetical protein